MPDKATFKLLKALCQNDLPESDVNKIIGRTSERQPDPRLTFLESEKWITVHVDGVPDGEGGYLDDTVTRIFKILPRGRAEAERVRKNHIKWMIGTGIALADAIGAILSALPSPAC